MQVRITYSAVRDWIQQIDKTKSASAALRLIELDLEDVHVRQERRMRVAGREIWQGAPPARARYVIERHPDRCDVVAVLPEHGAQWQPKRQAPGDERISGTVEIPDPAERLAPRDPGRREERPARAPVEVMSARAPTNLASQETRRALLGRLLRAERQARNIAASELAAMADVDEEVIQDIEDGYGAQDEQVWRVCEALQVRLRLERKA